MSKQQARNEIEKLMKKVFPASIISQQGKEVMQLLKEKAFIDKQRELTMTDSEIAETQEQENLAVLNYFYNSDGSLKETFR